MTPPTPRRRRAFTLLETMLAAAMGAVLVAGCVAVFAAIENHEQRLRARAAQVMGLARLRTVMQRACTTFVMAEPGRMPQNIGTGARTESGSTATPRTTPGASTPAAPDPAVPSPAPLAPGANGTAKPAEPRGTKASSVADATARLQAIRDVYAKSMPARILLDADESAAQWSMTRPSEATHTPGPVQRFEMVLTRHPLPTVTWGDPARDAAIEQAAAARAADKNPKDGSPAAPAGANAKSAAASKGTNPGKGDSPGKASAGGEGADDDSRLPDAVGAAVRGAFELRPAARSADPSRPRSWSLYWQPLTPLPSTRSEAERTEPPPVAVPNGPPVEVATDLEYVHWQVFRQRERWSAHRGLFYSDLPAYIEMEVRTIDGVWANWMFEVDWAIGSEGGPEPAPDAKKAEEESKADSKGKPGTGETGAPKKKFIPLNPKK